jgi:hypothetical protein
LTGLPSLAEVEGLFLVAVNVGTWVPNLSGLDYLDAAETLRSYIKVISGKLHGVAGNIPCVY